MASPKDLVLTSEYYTRFHIWQTIIKQLETIDSATAYDAKDLAEAGFEFVWGDGTDVQYELTEEEKAELKDEGGPQIIGTGGSYL